MSEILNKEALVEIVAEKLEMTKKDTTITVETVFDEVVKILSEGRKADTSGFGKFEISEHPACMGINPVTKEPLEIAAPRASEFKAAKVLKEVVKQQAKSGCLGSFIQMSFSSYFHKQRSKHSLPYNFMQAC